MFIVHLSFRRLSEKKERQKKEHARERMRKQRFIIIFFYTVVDVT